MTSKGSGVRVPHGPPIDVYAIWYTACMSKTVPVRELRAELSQVIDQVADLREHVIVTRHGRPAAVLVPVDEYEALDETAEILSDAETMAAIDEGGARSGARRDGDARRPPSGTAVAP